MIRALTPQRYSISANSPNYLSSFFDNGQKINYFTKINYQQNQF